MGKVNNKPVPEPAEKSPLNLMEFWTKLDALGARDFLPDGIPDDPPCEPGPARFLRRVSTTR
jgi:antitoxin VapB